MGKRRIFTEAELRVAETFSNSERDLIATEQQLTDAKKELERYKAALELIAAPARPDGTYNRSREACMWLAWDALYAPK